MARGKDGSLLTDDEFNKMQEEIKSLTKEVTQPTKSKDTKATKAGTGMFASIISKPDAKSEPEEVEEVDTVSEGTPDHPDDNLDMKTSFNDWIDYMTEEFPSVDAIHFYQTREVRDKKANRGLSGNRDEDGNLLSIPPKEDESESISDAEPEVEVEIEVMDEDPEHPDDSDEGVSFSEWLDYMEDKFPEIDAMHFYKTKEIKDK